MKSVDIVVIGAGPAGMAAASTAASLNANVLVLDEQPAPGGQIYRAILEADDRRTEILGPDYREGRDLARSFVEGSLEFEPSATVWRVDPLGSIAYSIAGAAKQVRGKRVVLATGALERPVPVPGWTLPGVMTAGAAQIMLKTASIVPQDAVLVGSGPLLYLVAGQLIEAGHPPKALVETQSPKDHFNAVRYFWSALKGWRPLAKGVSLLKAVRAAGVPRYTASDKIWLLGESEVEAVAFRSGSSDHTIACSTVLLHQGVVPNTQISRALRLDHQWNEAQHCFHPIIDSWGVTSNPVFTIAGDGAAIGGAKAAELSGRLAAMGAAAEIDLIDEPKRDALASPVRKELARHLAVRPFLDALYSPPDDVRHPEDATIICRCEEVTAGDIRRFAGLGCVGPNQTKAFSRCGMGPCQGRMCGLTVTEILARENGLSHDAVGAYRIRSPLKPVTLGEIAELDRKQEIVDSTEGVKDASLSSVTAAS